MIPTNILTYYYKEKYSDYEFKSIDVFSKKIPVVIKQNTVYLLNFDYFESEMLSTIYIEGLISWCINNSYKYVIMDQPYHDNSEVTAIRRILTVNKWDQYLQLFRSKRRSKLLKYLSNNEKLVVSNSISKETFKLVTKWSSEKYGEKYNFLNIDNNIIWLVLQKLCVEKNLFIFTYNNTAINIVYYYNNCFTILFQTGIKDGSVLMAKMLHYLMKNYKNFYIDYMIDDVDELWFKRDIWKFKDIFLRTISNTEWDYTFE